MQAVISRNKDKIYQWLAIVIILLGIWLRLYAYISNRSLILDEANVALNIHERGYSGLLQPLSYEQFAPPGFLWVLKFCTQLFGYSEYAFRLYPLLCSIASLFVLYRVLVLLTNKQAALYPLYLMAAGFIYMYYASCIKQYSSDVLIVLVAIWVTLSTDIEHTHPKRFVAIWAAVSIMLWFSMPLVFVLCGVASYYLYHVWNKRGRKYLPQLLVVFGIWALQFGVYYYGLLREQASSGYLQSFHKIYFSVLLPANAEEWSKNGELFGRIIASLGGETTLAYALHITCIIIGLVYLARTAKSRLLLFIVPVLCLYIASGFHVFTLLPRVVLFIMPMWLLLIGIGLHVLWRMRYKAVNYLLLVSIAICAYNFAQLKYVVEPLKHEEFKDAMSYAIKNHITDRHFHVNRLIFNVYKYYLELHPDKYKWTSLKNADEFPMWETDVIENSAAAFTKDMVIYAWYPEESLVRDIDIFKKYSRVTMIPIEGMHCYVCTRK